MARVLYDLLKPSDDYYLDCLQHDSDHSRPDRTLWYCEEALACQTLLAENCNADLLAVRSSNELYQGVKECSERRLMQGCDLNVLFVA